MIKIVFPHTMVQDQISFQFYRKITFNTKKRLAWPGSLGGALGEHWPRKRVWGCAALKTPFSRLSCRLQGSHFKQKSSSQDPFWENFEILASTASIFTQILAHKPPNLEIFSSKAPKFGNFPLTSPPPFQRQMSVRKPHTSEIRAAYPYQKKSWVPPPPRES